jgi:CRP/FNR family transcriptional regulator, cyclic AMP receptor protein
MAIIDDLAALPLFASLSPGQLQTLAKYADEIEVPADTELTHAGKYEGAVFAVVAGSIGIERDGQRVDTIVPGGFFGEIAAIDGGPRTATGRALEASRVIVLSPRQFNSVLEEASELRAEVMTAMEQRLARIDAEG